MTADTVLTLLGFAFVSTATPGPNNVMLMASGANFGVRRTVPHMAGISVGFPAMVALVGLGVRQIFDAWPPSYTLLTVLSAAYLFYLAWRIATAAPPGQAAPTARPFTFLQAAAFQWVNPKAWAMALSAVTLFAADRSLPSVLLVAAAFMLVSVPSVSLWAVLGSQVQRLLRSRTALRIFNGTMATVLLMSFLPGLFR